MPSFVFDIASDGIAKQTIDWDGGVDLRCLLIKGAGTPVKGNATVLDALADASVDECDATDYVRKTFASPTVSTSGNKTLFDADNPVWATLGGASNNTITGALIYKGTTNPGDDGTNIPIAYIDTNDLVTNGGQVTLSKDATNKWFFLDNT